jgi:hypothetical protein
MATIVKPNSEVISLVYYPGIVEDADEFPFIQEGGDGTDYDYVDVKGSINGEYRRNFSLFCKSSDITEIFLQLNPITNGFNIGIDRDSCVRLLVPAGQSIMFEAEGLNLEGFNIDFNGTLTEGAANIEQLIITIY